LYVIIVYFKEIVTVGVPSGKATGTFGFLETQINQSCLKSCFKNYSAQTGGGGMWSIAYFLQTCIYITHQNVYYCFILLRNLSK